MIVSTLRIPKIEPSPHPNHSGSPTRVEKINRSHTHRQENNTPDTDTHAHDKDNTPKTPWRCCSRCALLQRLT